MSDHDCNEDDGCRDDEHGGSFITERNALIVIASELRMLRKMAHVALYDPKSETMGGCIFSVTDQLETLNQHMAHLISHVADISTCEPEDNEPEAPVKDN